MTQERASVATFKGNPYHTDRSGTEGWRYRS